MAEEEEECKLLLEKLSLFLSDYKWLLDSFIIVSKTGGDYWKSAEP